MSDELIFDTKKTPAISHESEKTLKEAEMSTNENVEPALAGKKPKKLKNKNDEEGADVIAFARVYNVAKDTNPDMMTGVGGRRTFVMRPPQVLKAGSKKTAFANFTDICKVASIDGNEQLIIKGRFQQKHIESVLRKYIKEYVTCHTCKSPETLLQKDTRLFFLQFECCGSRCSVASIKTGFQALTGKRAQA